MDERLRKELEEILRRKGVAPEPARGNFRMRASRPLSRAEQRRLQSVAEKAARMIVEVLATSLGKDGRKNSTHQHFHRQAGSGGMGDIQEWRICLCIEGRQFRQPGRRYHGTDQDSKNT
ncbi:MAG: hypothetical protein N2506_06675 [Dehalococcoidales bacterium]|nr:hypothetical protein [Dehalococcoidales bacterium]